MSASASNATKKGQKQPQNNQEQHKKIKLIDQQGETDNMNDSNNLVRSVQSESQFANQQINQNDEISSNNDTFNDKREFSQLNKNTFKISNPKARDDNLEIDQTENAKMKELQKPATNFYNTPSSLNDPSQRRSFDKQSFSKGFCEKNDNSGKITNSQSEKVKDTHKEEKHKNMVFQNNSQNSHLLQDRREEMASKGEQINWMKKSKQEEIVLDEVRSNAAADNQQINIINSQFQGEKQLPPYRQEIVINNSSELQDNYNQPQPAEIQDNNDLDYFNLTENKNIEEICQKVHFVRNSLSTDFGKLKKGDQIIDNDALLGVDKEYELTEKQRKQRDYLVLSLRRRSQIFLVLNVIWALIIGLTYLESQDWFKMKTINSVSIDLLVTANGFTIMEMILWLINIIIGLNGIVNFSIICLRIYQMGILVTILFEFITNVILLSFVPLSLAKSLVIMLFHSFFFFAAQIVQNAMLAFRVKYIPILYHTQLQNMNDEENNIQVGIENDQIQQNNEIIVRQPINLVNQAGQTSAHQNHQQKDAQSRLAKIQFATVSQTNVKSQGFSLAKQIPKSGTLDNIYPFANFEDNQNNILKKNKEESSPPLQVNSFNPVRLYKHFSNPIEDSNSQIIAKQLQIQKNENKDKKQAFSVIELEVKEDFQNQKEIGSFPAYQKSQDKSDSCSNNSPFSNKQVFFNQDIIYNPNVNLNLQELKQQSPDSFKIHRKGTTVSSNAQGSQTTLPSNNYNLQRNNPSSQVCPHVDDIELNIVTI